MGSNSSGRTWKAGLTKARAWRVFHLGQHSGMRRLRLPRQLGSAGSGRASKMGVRKARAWRVVHLVRRRVFHLVQARSKDTQIGKAFLGVALPTYVPIGVSGNRPGPLVAVPAHKSCITMPYAIRRLLWRHGEDAFGGPRVLGSHLRDCARKGQTNSSEGLMATDI